jgi:hypothetical protein
MVNIVLAVYSKTGTRLLGPMLLGDLWQGFAIDDCTDLSGDPVVVYDPANAWLDTLPAGRRDGSPNYFVGTMDDGAGRGTPFDGINVFQFSVTWSAHPSGPSLWLLSCRSPRSTRSSHAPHQPELYPPTQDGQQGGHPLLPAAPDLPAGLPELRDL